LKSVYIIAEAGVNHNGDPDIALKLCEAAKEVGADAVKFQTWITEELLIPDAPLARYQSENSPGANSQYEMLTKLELNFRDFKKLKNHCDNIGIDFLTTPDEEQSLNFIVDELQLETIKIGSAETDNIPFLRKIGNKKKNVILSTGMSGFEEIDRAIIELQKAGAAKISILQCTSAYPCPIEEANLNIIPAMKSRYHSSIGFSDHTAGIEASIAAVALGAEIIEKHFTLDKKMEGPDHKASLNPDEFKQLVIAIRNIEKALGSRRKQITASEREIKDVVSKKIVAKKDISIGETFDEYNISAKRSEKGISVSEWDQIIGTAAKQEFHKDDLIEV
jgi:N,N'-diacetyllegionaminate synthase